MPISRLVLALAAVVHHGPNAPDRSACTTDHSGLSAHEWLAQAAAAIGMERDAGRVLHYQTGIARDMPDQSDRAYPPFIKEITSQDHWFDPVTGVDRMPMGPATVLRGPRSAYRLSGDTVRPAPEIFAIITPQRDFNPWAVLADWLRDSSARVVGRCPYLDFERVVLARRAALGEERLLIDPGSRFPLTLRTTELHYFLGPVHDEYRYAAWSDIAPSVYYPASTIKRTDGLGEEVRSAFPGHVSMVRRDSAPSLGIPDSTIAASPIPPPRFGDQDVDTVRAGPQTFLLVDSRFTSVVTMAADTIYLIDAAAGELRARRDSAWIGRLFPGRHPVTLVLLSAVWPHIAGVRYWVAAGARITGHPLTGALVRQAVARPWTEYPDALERARTREHTHDRIRFHAVSGSEMLADGQLRLYQLDGAGNEGTLMAYVPRDRFLWASDRVQDVRQPSLYVTELVCSVQQAGVSPQWTSGPHLRLVPWDSLAVLNAPPTKCSK